MFIKQITIAGQDGRDVVMSRTEIGCEVRHGDQRIALIEALHSDPEQFSHATTVAGAIYGTTTRRDGSIRPCATNSMIYSVLMQMLQLLDSPA